MGLKVLLYVYEKSSTLPRSHLGRPDAPLPPERESDSFPSRHSRATAASEHNTTKGKENQDMKTGYDQKKPDQYKTQILGAFK